VRVVGQGRVFVCGMSYAVLVFEGYCW